MPASDPVAERIVLEFLRRYAEDARRGLELGVAHYRALYPEHAARIALEWEALQQDDVAPAPEGARALDAARARDAAPDDDARRLGPYRLFEVVGRGGQGVVHRAVDERIGRTVALKLLPGLAPEDGLPARVQREVEAIARLDHPGLGVVYEAGVLEGQVYLAMRYVPGRSLAELMAERVAAGAHDSARDASTTRLAPRDGDSTTQLAAGATHTHARRRRDRLRDDVFLVEKLARALHAAHEAGVVHRDVKPANVMIHESGEPVLLDFGLARAEHSELATLTASGELLGTTAYMAPERLRGDADCDRRADVWSLGVLLYELLTGRRPFEGPGVDEISRRIRLEEPSDPRRLERGIPRDLAVVLGTALEKDVGRRYPTALALAEELARVRAGRPVLAKPPNPLGRLRRWAWRHPALASLTLLLLATVVGSLWAAVAFADLADAERTARENSEQLNVALQRNQDALRDAADSERSARRAAEALLVQRGAEQAELLRLNGQLGRRWEMLDVLAAAASTRAQLEPPLPDDLPSVRALRDLAASALLLPDARHDRVIQRSSLGSGRFSRDASRLALTWVAPDFQSFGVRLLDTSDGAELVRMDAGYLISNSFSVALTDDAEHLLIPRSDGVSLWRSPDAMHARQLEIPDAVGPTTETSRWEVGFFPGERYALGVGAPGRDPARPAGWVIWDLVASRAVQHAAADTDLHDWFAFARDGRHLLLPVGGTRLQLLRLPVGPDGAPVVAEIETAAPVRAALLGAGDDPELHLLQRPTDGGPDLLVRRSVDGEVFARVELPERAAESAGLLRRSPDGALLAVATERGDVLLLDPWHLATRLVVPAGSVRKLEDLRFAASGRELLTHSGQEGTDAWELLADTGLRHAPQLRPQGPATLSWSADGRLVAALQPGHAAPTLAWAVPRADTSSSAAAGDDTDDAPRVATAAPELARLTLPAGAAPLERLALSDDGARLIAVGADAAWSWTPPEPAPTPLPCPPDSAPLALGFGADGAPRLLARLADGTSALVRLDDGTHTSLPVGEPAHWIFPDARLRHALFVSQAGVRPPLRLATGPLSQGTLVDGPTRALAGLDAAAFKQVFSARVSRDGTRLAAVVYVPLEVDAQTPGVDDCRLMLWDLATGALLWSVPVEPQAASVAPALGDDGRLVLAADPRGRVALRDGDSGALLLSWQAHDAAELTAVELLGDGARAATLGDDGALSVWELAKLRAQLGELGLGF